MQKGLNAIFPLPFFIEQAEGSEYQSIQKELTNHSLTYSQMKLRESFREVISIATSLIKDNIQKSSKNT